MTKFYHNTIRKKRESGEERGRGRGDGDHRHYNRTGNKERERMQQCKEKNATRLKKGKSHAENNQKTRKKEDQKRMVLNTERRD